MFILQSSNYMPLRSTINFYLKLPYVHLRYSLGGDRPSQTTSHKLSFKKLSKINLKRWYFTIAFAPTYSTLKERLYNLRGLVPTLPTTSPTTMLFFLTHNILTPAFISFILSVLNNGTLFVSIVFETSNSIFNIKTFEHRHICIITRHLSLYNRFFIDFLGIT